MPNEIWAALIGGGATLVVTLLTLSVTTFLQSKTQAADERKRESEERRWYAEFLIPGRLETVLQLHKRIVQFNLAVKHSVGLQGDELGHWSKQHIQEGFRTANSMRAEASIYFKEADAKLLRDALAHKYLAISNKKSLNLVIWPMHDVDNQFVKLTPDEQMQMAEVEYDQALHSLQQYLNPKVLAVWDEQLSQPDLS